MTSRRHSRHSHRPVWVCRVPLGLQGDPQKLLSCRRLGVRNLQVQYFSDLGVTKTPPK